MTPKIKNIIIFSGIAFAFILIYIFFIRPSSSNQANLISSPNASALPNIVGTAGGGDTANTNPLVAKDFLALLSNVKNLKLDDIIFSDPAFNSLHDSSITLVGDGTEGRPNPFAQFGNDILPTPATPANTILPPTNPAVPATPPAPAKPAKPVKP